MTGNIAACHPAPPPPPPHHACEPLNSEMSAAEFFDRLFSATDKDKNGTINMQELGDLLEYARQQSGAGGGSPVQDSAVQHVLQQADTTGDGALNYDEFMQFLKSALVETESPVPTTTPTTSPTAAEQYNPATDGMMIDQNHTTEEMKGAGYGGDYSSTCHNTITVDAEALFEEFQAQYQGCIHDQNTMIEFRNFLQSSKGMNCDQANAVVGAINPAYQHHTNNSTSAPINTADIFSANIAPSAPSEHEDHHNASAYSHQHAHH